MVESFQRRKERDHVLDAALPASTETAARRRVCSMLYALTKTNEIASSLAAHYLLGKRAVYMSRKTGVFLLAQSLAASNQEDVDADVVRGADEAHFVAVTQVLDYTLRPLALSEIPHFVFIE